MIFRPGELGRRALKKPPESGPTVLPVNDRQHANRAVFDQLPLARLETCDGVAVFQRCARYQHQFSRNRLSSGLDLRKSGEHNRHLGL